MRVNLPLLFYQVGWAVWGVYFIVLETLAILDGKPFDTLSENIRWIRDRHPWLLIILIGSLLTWLFVHFLFQDNRKST
jgi:hypothetical protein